jgi:nitrite reductase/ring-hydroxylating ferredoxin subunit
MVQQEHRVAEFEALAPGQMQSVDIEGQTVLLIRDGEGVYCFGGTCPHAGGLLASVRTSGGRFLTVSAGTFARNDGSRRRRG